MLLACAGARAASAANPAPAAQLAAPVRLASIGTLPDEDAAPPRMPVPTTPRLQPKTPPTPERSAERPVAPKGPLDNWKMFDAHFEACLEPVAGPEEATLTLRFAVDAKGRLRGKPQATYSKLPGGPEEQRAFVIEALNSLAGCLPLDVTPRFGPIVAQRPLILRFLAPQPKQRGI
ncbi:hypothetical protein GCM10007301_04190 [Azorhizobium oxalatiphilum]|uniref:TonB C-terminal domain-containing protein n=1 Tax=Azorhizobium oxalatiphilum TaxID=980631 RepID=A0A917BL46_9HYPH|nr:hypothetical protein [Azorhizobium oxalatiphilum]GGF48050.1 hypothetical protein GCM10007301_04190 [Azorhizobium oxalatiphilum]